MASIGKKNKTSKKWIHICTATVVSHTSILSAAHCFTSQEISQKVSNKKLRLGDTRLLDSQDDDYAIEMDIKAIAIHPKYQTMRPNQNQEFDVAVIYPDKFIEFTEGIKPICLPEKSNTDPYHRKGQMINLLGWGYER